MYQQHVPAAYAAAVTAAAVLLPVAASGATAAAAATAAVAAAVAAAPAGKRLHEAPQRATERLRFLRPGAPMRHSVRDGKPLGFRV